VKLALAALQGAVFGIVAMRLVGGESLRFVLYGAVALPVVSVLVSAWWPRLAVVLGVVLVGLWTATCGALAYEDPSLQAWEWIPGLALLGLLFGAGANAYLFRGAEDVESNDAIAELRRRRSRVPPEPDASSAARDHAAPSPPLPQHEPRADPWSILGVAHGAPPHEIRRAFRARMAEYHPDKVAALGAELRELAEAKSKEITAAFGALDGR
jgi:hypothetical protein